VCSNLFKFSFSLLLLLLEVLQHLQQAATRRIGAAVHQATLSRDGLPSPQAPPRASCLSCLHRFAVWVALLLLL